MCIGGKEFDLDLPTDREMLETALKVEEHPKDSGSKYFDAGSLREAFTNLDKDWRWLPHDRRY